MAQGVTYRCSKVKCEDHSAIQVPNCFSNLNLPNSNFASECGTDPQSQIMLSFIRWVSVTVLQLTSWLTALDPAQQVNLSLMLM